MQLLIHQLRCQRRHLVYPVRHRDCDQAHGRFPVDNYVQRCSQNYHAEQQWQFQHHY